MSEDDYGIPPQRAEDYALQTGDVLEEPQHAAANDLIDQDPAVLQERWRDVQAGFVDDPGEAVQRADGLVVEVVESLTSTLNARTTELRESTKDGDTEQLRQALRDYRGVLEQLLAFSGTR